jgi:hypothetical protein
MTHLVGRLVAIFVRQAGSVVAAAEQHAHPVDRDRRRRVALALKRLDDRQPPQVVVVLADVK